MALLDPSWTSALLHPRALGSRPPPPFPPSPPFYCSPFPRLLTCPRPDSRPPLPPFTTPTQAPPPHLYLPWLRTWLQAQADVWVLPQVCPPSPHLCPPWLQADVRVLMQVCPPSPHLCPPWLQADIRVLTQVCLECTVSAPVRMSLQCVGGGEEGHTCHGTMQNMSRHQSWVTSPMCTPSPLPAPPPP